MVVKRDNIIQLELPEKGDKLLSQQLYVFQWDKGQKLEILNVSDGTEVQFGNDKVEVTLNRIKTNGFVDIPDIMLTYAEPISAYVQYINSNSETTRIQIVLKVIVRPMPGDYVYPDDEQSFREQMEQIMIDTKKIAQNALDKANDVEKRANDGEFDGKTGPQGPEGKQGEKGQDGYTPVKGIDYFTNDDIQAISNITTEKVINDLPSATQEKNGTLKLATLDDIRNANKSEEAIKAIVFNPYYYLYAAQYWTNQNIETGTSGNFPSLPPRTTAVKNYVENKLQNYVQTSRKIVGQNLSKDVSIYDIINALYDNTGENPLSDFEFLLMRSKTIKDTNNEVDKKVNKADFSKDVQVVGGAFDSLETVDKSNYVSAINEILKLATRERTWKKIRTITVPGDEFKGQTIDGVRYGYSGENGIKEIGFKTDKNGNELSQYKITGLQLKVTPVVEININQGFASVGSMALNVSSSNALDYFTGFKNTTALRWFEYTTYPTMQSAVANNPGQYRLPGKRHNFIDSFAWGGFEATSTLGEGTKIEVWAYGYWEEEEAVNGE